MSKPKISKRTHNVLLTVAFVVDVITVASNYNELVSVCKTAIVQARGPNVNQTGVDNICEWERVNDWCKSGFVLEGNCPLLKDYDDKYHNSKNVTKLCESPGLRRNRAACEAAKFYEPTCWQFTLDSCRDRSMLFWICLVCTLMSGIPVDEKVVFSHPDSTWKLSPGRARFVQGLTTVMKLAGKIGFRLANGFATSPIVFLIGWITFGMGLLFVLPLPCGLRKGCAGTDIQKLEFRSNVRFVGIFIVFLVGVCVGIPTLIAINETIGVTIDLQMSMDFSLPSLSINTLAVFTTFVMESFRLWFALVVMIHLPALLFRSTGFNAVGGVVEGIADIEMA